MSQCECGCKTINPAPSNGDNTVEKPLHEEASVTSYKKSNTSLSVKIAHRGAHLLYQSCSRRLCSRNTEKFLQTEVLYVWYGSEIAYLD